MTDINRRGFLQLLGVTGAMAAMPRAALAVIEAPPPDLMRLHSGLWARADGAVRWLGDLQSVTLERGAIAIAVPRYGLQQFAPASLQLPEATFTLRVTNDGAQGLHWLQNRLMRSYLDMNPYCDLLAVMRPCGQHSDQESDWKTLYNDNTATALRVRRGDIIIAMRRAFLTNWEAELTPYEHMPVTAQFKLGTDSETGHVDDRVQLHNAAPDSLLSHVLQLEDNTP